MVTPGPRRPRQRAGPWSGVTHVKRRRPWAVVLSEDAVGLGAVRSLHAGGVPTIVVMCDPMEPARFSRFGHKILVPKTGDVEGAILEVLSRIRSEEHTSELQSPVNL